MTDLSIAQIEEIERGLERLHDGPWFVAPSPAGDGLAIVEDGRSAGMWPIVCEWHEAYHIARLDPDTVRSLLAMARRSLDGAAEPSEEVVRLRRLVGTLLDNDPNEDAADGVSVLDVWRKEARDVLGL